MMVPADAITIDVEPDRDAVLERDLRFHLGERSWYDFAALKTAYLSHAPPSDCFMVIRGRKVLIGKFFEPNCRFARFAGNRLVCRDPAAANLQQQRSVATVNRDLQFLDPDLSYCLDFRVHTDVDYASFFGTAKPLPVFQYHRQYGRAAIIHPLSEYHECPSPNIPKLSDSTPFAAKRPAMFWRGSLHGNAVFGGRSYNQLQVALLPELIGARLDLLRQSLRFRLCERSVEAGDILDAALVAHPKGPLLRHPVPELQPLLREPLDRAKQLECRYLLALDGADGPSSHYWALATNSLVLRQESPWEMFGDSYFIPGIHYITFAADGSDLFEKFAWCESHREECEWMVANAKRAWSTLFDPRYTVARRQAIFNRYRAWARDDLC